MERNCKYINILCLPVYLYITVICYTYITIVGYIYYLEIEFISLLQDMYNDIIFFEIPALLSCNQKKSSHNRVGGKLKKYIILNFSHIFGFLIHNKKKNE